MGRKTKREEFEACKKIIKQEALIELANQIGYKRLQELSQISPKASEIKDLVMPIILKGMSEKVFNQHSGTVKHIHSQDIENSKEIQALKEEYEQKLKDELSK